MYAIRSYYAVGPEHAYLRDLKRATYTYIRDEEAYNAFCALSQYEGIIPASYNFV